MKNEVRLPFLEQRVCLWTKAAITGRILDSLDFPIRRNHRSNTSLALLSRFKILNSTCFNISIQESSEISTEGWFFYKKCETKIEDSNEKLPVDSTIQLPTNSI